MTSKRRGKHLPRAVPVLSPDRTGPGRDVRPLVETWWGRRWLEAVMLIDTAYIRHFGTNLDRVRAGAVRNLRLLLARRGRMLVTRGWTEQMMLAHRAHGFASGFRVVKAFGAAAGVASGFVAQSSSTRDWEHRIEVHYGHFGATRPA